MRTITSLAAVLALGGCSVAVGDLGNLTEDVEACRPGGDVNSVRDFRFELYDASAHIPDLFHIDVVNAESGTLACRVLLDALVVGTQTIVVPNAVPPGAHYVDFYGDLDGNGIYSPVSTDNPMGDHTWNRPLCDDGSLAFEHIAQFEPANSASPIGLDATVRFTNIPSLAAGAASLEMHVIADFEGQPSQTVGVFRRTNVERARVLPLGIAETLTIPEVVDARTPYRIAWWIDLNRDGLPDGGAERVCVTEVLDTEAGIDITLDVMVERASGNCDFDALPDLDEPR